MADSVSRILGEVRRRLLVADLMRCSFAAALLAGGIASAAGAVRALGFGESPLEFWLLPMAVIFLLGAGAWAFVRRASEEEAARVLDCVADTRDRLTTALELANKSGLTPVERLAVGECSAYCREMRPRMHLPLRPPRLFAVLLVPVGCLALLEWHWRLTSAPQPEDPAAAVVRAGGDLLARLADTLPGEGLSAEELARLTSQMREGAARMRAPEGGEATHAALKELSSLEALLEAMLKSAQISPEELARLADALRARPDAAEAADLLEQGRVREASDHLQSLLEKMRESGRADAALEQLAQSLESLADGLDEAQQEQVQRQMAEAAEAAQAGGRDAQLRAAMQQLARALSEAGGSGAPRDPAASGTARAMTLQEILDAIERLKEGVRDPALEGGGIPGASRFALPGPSGEGDTSGGDSPLPSGQPGSEMDSGTTADAFGEATPQETPEGPAQGVAGRAGQGQVLQEMMAAAGDSSRARQGYRELYEVMAPAAEDAILRENIPLGSRPLIRRYFENIRPPE